MTGKDNRTGQPAAGFWLCALPFFRHVWKITETTEQVSPSELLSNKEFSGAVDTDKFFTKPVIVREMCERCGSERVYRI